MTNYIYQNAKFSNEKTKTFNLALESGKMVSSHFAIGGLSGYRSAKIDQNSVNVTDQSVFVAGVFGRYFYTPEKKFSFFNDFQGVYSRAVNNKNTSQKADGIGGVVSVGVIYWLGNSFGLNASFAGLTYTSASLDQYNSTAVENFSFGGDLTALKIGGFFKF